MRLAGRLSSTVAGCTRDGDDDGDGLDEVANPFASLRGNRFGLASEQIREMKSVLRTNTLSS